MSPPRTVDPSRLSSVTWEMKLFASVVLALAFTTVANGGASQTVHAHGVALTAPAALFLLV